MPTTRADRRRRAGAALAALTLLAAGCSADDPVAPPAADPSAPSQAGPSGTPVRAPDVVRGLTRALDRRAAAVLAGDRDAFLAGVAAPARDAEATYFDNLAALPVGYLGYRLDRASLVRDAAGYWVEVEVSLQLDGYDAVPVTTRDRYRFVPARGAGFRLGSRTDPAWEEQHGTHPQPWDAGPVVVLEGSGALGILDPGSAGAAGRVVRDVEAGIAAVAEAVPYPWDRRVVVYALSQPDFLAGLEDVPGGDPLALDAVTLPVAARPGSAETAGLRFVLHPRMVAAPGPARDRLIRHELTHVALGARQDVAPTWLREGLAEYVSVRALDPADRAISGAALDAAEDGVTAMPADETFHGPASKAHYGLAWWACEYLAKEYGEEALWRLLDALDAPEDAATEVRRLTGSGESRLARKAARLMLRTYRPAEPDEEPSGSPSEDASDEPSDGSSQGPSDAPSDGSSEEPSDGDSGSG